MAETFTVNVAQDNGIWIFETHGYINNLAGEAISEKYREAFDQGGRQFLFDLEDSKIINSVGVSILIEILEEIVERNGTMAFCHCVPIVKKTFNIMGITQYASIYETRSEALAAMREN
ncbi:STAS domain-containing protein [bacterium]|nr:STAS domain-containing protein [bacterium]